MKKEDMAAAMSGITTRPRTSTKGAIIKDEPKKIEERKVVSIYYSDWKKLKQYATENDTTITAVIAKLVEDSTIL